MFADVMLGIISASAPTVKTPNDSPRSQLRSIDRIVAGFNFQRPLPLFALARRPAADPAEAAGALRGC
jgi:hypothetical protein